MATLTSQPLPAQGLPVGTRGPGVLPRPWAEAFAGLTHGAGRGLQSGGMKDSCSRATLQAPGATVTRVSWGRLYAVQELRATAGMSRCRPAGNPYLSLLWPRGGFAAYVWLWGLRINY